jgi:cadmium resistance protein CadD (predicted permease)
MLATNVGNVDRVVRIVVGLALLALVFVGPQTLWGLIGLVPLATGLARKCPGYALLGMNTCGDRKAA